MRYSVRELMFELLRSAVTESRVRPDCLSDCGAEEIQSLFRISKLHDIAHLIAFALEKNALMDKSKDYFAPFKKELFTAVYRYETINYEFERICVNLEAAGVPFVPLKGAVLRRYYPEPWMRTSCDIDILIHQEDVERATACLTDNCGYRSGTQSSHDVSLFSANGMHTELHYNLVEDGRANESSVVLKSVWETCAPHVNKTYRQDMADDMFYFYHIAHMAKHIEEGGCGIRPFVDLWILDKIEDAECNKRDCLLKQGGLLKFAEVARLLSKVWFDGAEHTETTKQMENYILRGGVYGTSENRIAVQQQKRGGRLSYAMSKIFLPYDAIKFHYPILQKHRWLTPLMEVRRWFKLVFCGHAKRSVSELKRNNSISDSEAEAVRSFLENIGL